MRGLFTRRTKLPLSWHIYLRHLKFRSSLFKGLRIPKAEPLVGFKGEALNILCPNGRTQFAPTIYLLAKINPAYRVAVCKRGLYLYFKIFHKKLQQVFCLLLPEHQYSKQFRHYLNPPLPIH